MKCVVYWAFAFLIMQAINCEMSEKQLKSAIKLIKNVCQPKHKISNDMLETMHKGVFQQDRTLMCYMECCLRMGRLTKDGKFDLDSALSQARNLAEDRRQPTIDSSTNCKEAGSTKADKCEAAFEIYKCIYDYNPQNFFLP